MYCQYVAESSKILPWDLRDLTVSILFSGCERSDGADNERKTGTHQRNCRSTAKNPNAVKAMLVFCRTTYHRKYAVHLLGRWGKKQIIFIDQKPVEFIFGTSRKRKTSRTSTKLSDGHVSVNTLCSFRHMRHMKLLMSGISVILSWIRFITTEEAHSHTLTATDACALRNRAQLG